MSPGVMTPPVATRRVRSKPAGGRRRRGCTASIVAVGVDVDGTVADHRLLVVVRDDGAGQDERLDGHRPRATSCEDLPALVRGAALELRLLVVVGGPERGTSWRWSWAHVMRWSAAAMVASAVWVIAPWKPPSEPGVVGVLVGAAPAQQHLVHVGLRDLALATRAGLRRTSVSARRPRATGSM